MAINFRGGPPKPPSARPSDPIKIFQARPSIDSQVTDLWRGQAKALEDWYTSSENDILISLNTGAGKSILGTLICQSWLNSGVQNPVYLCATNDLVDQTAREATKLALKFTTRTSGEFSNDLFESGQGFLVTSYQTLFNAKTKLRGDLAPGAVLFDDAHVGEPTIRGQFTLSIEKKRHNALFATLIEVIDKNLSATDRQQLRLVLNIHGQSDSFLCPPETGAALNELLGSLSAQFNGDGLAHLHFPYLQLVTHFDACAVVVRTDSIELSPPFLPTRTVSALKSNDIKRVYLSATLKAESEFVRAYGRRPGKIIEPEVDAGNGERTIINVRKLDDRDGLIDWAHTQSRKGKVLVATPSRSKAAAWAAVAKPPETDKFNAELKDFRAAKKGGFVLAGRFDGIDLPDSTCRLMIIAGLPSGGSALETYLWQIFEMQNLLAARVATRVTQLFGRIIRGRNDYGLFLVYGGDLTNWLLRDRNLALLPDLLQKQVKLGQTLNDEWEIKTLKSVGEFYEQVAEREEGWLEYYRSYIDDFELDDRDVRKRRENEQSQLKSAVAESKFIEALWQHRFADAAEALEECIETIAESDSKLAGWLNLWSGAARALGGADEAAREHYRIAKSRLPIRMELPIDPADDDWEQVEAATTGDAALRALCHSRARTFGIQIKRAAESASLVTSKTSTSSACEEAYRAAGSFLGYTASRPDEETAAGPDVLWIDEINSVALSFELKTDKALTSTLTKKEIGQSHNHIQWIRDNYPKIELVQHFLVGWSLGVSNNASPDPEWQHNEPTDLLKLVQSFISESKRIRTLGKELKAQELARISAVGSWNTASIAQQLSSRPMVK